MFTAQKVAAAVLMLASCATAQEEPPSRSDDAQRAVATLSEKDKEAMQALIGQLAVRADERGSGQDRYVSKARIENVADKLAQYGRPGWGVLLAHEDDRRRSATFAQGGAPTVTGKCRGIVITQLESYPDGYPTRRAGGDTKIDRIFRPSMKEWLDERKEVPLEDIQIEVLEHVIQFETEEADNNPAAAKAVEILKPHLEKLKAARPANKSRK
jgi:hypothetical protein